MARLINVAPTLGLIMSYRCVYIGGGMGSGKTLVAYRLAWELLRTGQFRYLVSNGRNVWANEVGSVVPRANADGQPQFLDAVIVLDEGGHIIEGAAHGAAMKAFARKLNIVVLVPSVEPPPANMRVLQMARTFNGAVFGLPLQWWSVTLSTRFFRGKYGFGVWRPQQMYGIYDTEDFTQDEDEIQAMLAGVVHERRGASGENTAGSRRGRRRVVSVGQRGGFARDVAAATEELSAAVSLFADVTGRRRRR